MGCDDYPILGGRYQMIGDPVAVTWNPELAQQFPHAEHPHCRQQLTIAEPVECVDYHCPRCGTATGMYGHQTCTTTPREKQ